MAETNKNNTVSDDQEQLATYDEANSESDIGFYQELFAQFKKGFQIATPAVVERHAYTPIKTNTNAYRLYVAVRPLVQRAVKTANGMQYVDRPVYVVPVLGFGGGGTSICTYPKVGSVGLLLAGDRNSDTAIAENAAFEEDIDVDYDALQELNSDKNISNTSNDFLGELKSVSISTNKGPQPPDDYSTGSFHNGFFVPCNFGCVGVIKKAGGYYATSYPSGCAIESYRILGEGTENEEKVRASIVNVTSSGVRAEGDSISAKGKWISISAPGGIDRAKYDDPKNKYNGGDAHITLFSDYYEAEHGKKTSYIEIGSNGDPESESASININCNNGRIGLYSGIDIDETGTRKSEREIGIRLSGYTEINELHTEFITGSPSFYIRKYVPKRNSEPDGRFVISPQTMTIVTGIAKVGNSLVVSTWSGDVYAQKEGYTDTETIPL